MLNAIGDLCERTCDKHAFFYLFFIYFFGVNRVVKEASYYLKNKQLNPLPIFYELFQRWGAVACLSMLCMQNQTFHVSVIASVLLWILFSMYPIASTLFCYFSVPYKSWH